MGDIYLRPSDKLLMLVDIHATRNAFTSAFDLPYTTFVDWLDGQPGASLPGNLVAKLIERTRLPYDDLFVHSDRKPRPAAKR